MVTASKLDASLPTVGTSIVFVQPEGKYLGMSMLGRPVSSKLTYVVP